MPQKRKHRSALQLKGHLSEHSLQVQVLARLDDLVQLPVFIMANENRPATIAQARVQAARGVKAGQPDLFLLQAGKIIGIELKRPDGPVRLSRAQLERRAELLGAGAQWICCRSVRAVLVGLLENGFTFRHTWDGPDPDYDRDVEGPWVEPPSWLLAPEDRDNMVETPTVTYATGLALSDDAG